MRSFTRLIAIETIRVSSISRLSRAASNLTVDYPSKCEVGLLLTLAILKLNPHLHPPQHDKRSISVGIIVLVPVTERRLKIAAAVKNTFDEHRRLGDDEGNGDAPFKSGHAQPGQEIVARRAPHRKGSQALTEVDDAANVWVGAIFAGVGGDVPVEGVEMAFSERREDDLHKLSLGLARGAPGLDALKDRVGRHAFAGVG
jgi:hypothetical protein